MQRQHQLLGYEVTCMKQKDQGDMGDVQHNQQKKLLSQGQVKSHTERDFERNPCANPHPLTQCIVSKLRSDHQLLSRTRAINSKKRQLLHSYLSQASVLKSQQVPFLTVYNSNLQSKTKTTILKQNRPAVAPATVNTHNGTLRRNETGQFYLTYRPFNQGKDGRPQKFELQPEQSKNRRPVHFVQQLARVIRSGDANDVLDSYHQFLQNSL